MDGQYSPASGMLQATKTYVEEDEDFSGGEGSGSESGSDDEGGDEGGEEDDIAAELAALKVSLSSIFSNVPMALHPWVPACAVRRSCRRALPLLASLLRLVCKWQLIFFWQ